MFLLRDFGFFSLFFLFFFSYMGIMLIEEEGWSGARSWGLGTKWNSECRERGEGQISVWSRDMLAVEGSTT